MASANTWPHRVHVLVALTTFYASPVMAAEDCYTASGIAGIVVATIIVTLVIVGLGFGLLWYLRRRRSGARIGEIKDDMPLGDPSGSDCKYAFDNPYFKEEDGEKITLDSAEKGQANAPVKPNCAAPSSPQCTKQNQAASQQQASQVNATAAAAAGAKNKKRKLSISHPFAVFNPSVKKQQRAMDDSCLAVEPERMTVPLRGHDFTGLGFNVCGNMRDGIFVKDVLHRGPASESGKVKAGDRIVSVTVSFTNMVYEDALTILSYASPYDVQLEIEKATDKSHAVTALGPSGKRLCSSSFSGSGQRLFHPLYRSQSIDDLTQIGKDSFHPNTQGASPKRSQSIGLTSQPAIGMKSNLLSRHQESVGGNTGEEVERVLKPISLATGSLNEKVLASAMGEDAKKLKLEVQKEAAVIDHSASQPADMSDLKDATANSQTKEPTPDNAAKSVNSASNKESKHSLQEVGSGDSEQKKDEKSQSLPRKTATPGKRKAPPPPPTATSASAYAGVPLKTTAQIHQQTSQLTDCSISVQDEVDTKGSEDLESPLSSEMDKDSIGAPPGSELLESIDIDSLDQSSLLNNPGSRLLEDTNTDSEGSNDSLQHEDAIPPPKSTNNNSNNSTQRKSSSLVDLTKMAEGSASKSVTQLERAVSMDFKQQPLPEGNLGQQKKMLHPPHFGSESISEDYESSLNPEEESVQKSPPKTNLVKWNSHGVWDEANQLQNGDDLTATGISLSASVDVNQDGSKESHNKIALDIPSTKCYDGSNDGTSLAIDEALNDMSSSLPNITSSLEDESTNTLTLTSTPVRRFIKSGDFLKSSDLANGRNDQNGVEGLTEEDIKKGIGVTTSGSPGNIRNESIILSSPPYLHNTISIDIPVIPPIVDRHSPLSNPPRGASSTVASHKEGANPSKEVIEISENELDDVMMSHRQFLLKQAKVTGIYSNLNPDINRPASEIDFESWSYDEGSYAVQERLEDSSTTHPKVDSVNGNGSDTSSYYRTALEINDLSNVSSKDTSSTTKKPVMPEISGYTVRTSEGGITKTIIISNPEASVTASAVPVSDSPPPNLEPPH